MATRRRTPSKATKKVPHDPHNPVFYLSEDGSAEFRSMTNAELCKALRIAHIRLSLAQAWVKMLSYAYDALLLHRVTYKVLKQYEDHALLDRAANEPLDIGQSSYITWTERMYHDIRAAVARKNIRKV